MSEEIFHKCDLSRFRYCIVNLLAYKRRCYDVAIFCLFHMQTFCQIFPYTLHFMQNKLIRSCCTNGHPHKLFKKWGANHQRLKNSDFFYRPKGESKNFCVFGRYWTEFVRLCSARSNGIPWASGIWRHLFKILASKQVDHCQPPPPSLFFRAA